MGSNVRKLLAQRFLRQTRRFTTKAPEIRTHLERKRLCLLWPSTSAQVLATNNSRRLVQVFLPPQSHFHSSCPQHQWKGLKLRGLIEVMDRNQRALALASQDTDLREVIQELKATQTGISSEQAETLVVSCGARLCSISPSKRLQYLAEIVEQLMQKDVSLNVGFFNSLMKTYEDNDYSFSPVEVLKSIVERGALPNELTFQLMLNQLCLQKDGEGAWRIVAAMKAQSIAVEECQVQSLLDGKWEENLSETSFSMFLRNCGGAGQGDLVDAVLKTANTKNLRFRSIREFHLVVVAMAKGGLLGKLDRLLVLSPSSRELLCPCSHLLFLGHPQSAYRLLLSIPQPSAKEAGNVFAQLLVAANRPPTEIIQFAHQMQKDGLCSSTLESAVGFAFESPTSPLMYSDKKALVGELLKQWKGRPQLFWPLLAEAVARGDKPELKDILVWMQGLTTVDFDTYYTPIFSINSQLLPVEEAMADARANGTLARTPLMGFMRLLLEKGQIGEATDALKLLEADDHTGKKAALYLLESLVNLVLQSSGDELSAVLDLVQTLSKHFKGNYDFVGEVLLFAIVYAGSNGIALKKLDEVSRVMTDKNMTIKSRNAAEICTWLVLVQDFHRLQLIAKITDPDLPLLALPKKKLDEEELENALTNAPSEARNKQLYNLLVACVENNHLAKAENVFQLLSEGAQLFPGSCALMIKLYIKNGLLHQAGNYVSLMNEKGFGLSTIIMCDLLVELLKMGKIEEVQSFLLKWKRNHYDAKHSAEGSLTLSGKFDDFLAVVEEKLSGDIYQLRNFVDICISTGFFPFKRRYLSLLLKFHINKGDVTGAVEECDRILKQHSILPQVEEMFDAALNKGEPHLIHSVLSKVEALSDKDERLATAELIGVLLERGEIQMATRHLQDCSFITEVVNRTCKKAIKHKSLITLERLQNTIPSFNNLHINLIMISILEIHYHNCDGIGVKAVLKEMKEKNVRISDETKKKANYFCFRLGMPLPFHDVLPKGQSLFTGEEHRDAKSLLRKLTKK